MVYPQTIPGPQVNNPALKNEDKLPVFEIECSEIAEKKPV